MPSVDVELLPAVKWSAAAGPRESLLQGAQLSLPAQPARDGDGHARRDIQPPAPGPPPWAPGRFGRARPSRRRRFLCAVAAAAAAQGKRILHIDSYHKGNEWNDRIAAALVEVLAAGGRRGPRRPSRRQAPSGGGGEAGLRARRVRDLIEETRPDLVTLSDDDAAKYVLAPYFKDGALPFVFCGLNWDASVYGLPYPNTTGMVEVSPIPQIVSLLRRYARGARIGFLSEDTDTKRKEILHHKRLFGVDYDKTYLARTFAEWKEAYEQAQSEVDMLLVLGVGAIADFDTPAAAEFAERVSRIPTGTDFEWLMPVSAFGIAKSPEEQGRWAAQAAIEDPRRHAAGPHPGHLQPRGRADLQRAHRPPPRDRLAAAPRQGRAMSALTARFFPDGLKRPSIAGRTLWSVAFRITIVMAVATAISYWNVRTGLESQGARKPRALRRAAPRPRERHLPARERQRRDLRDSLCGGLAADRSARGREPLRGPLRRAARRHGAHPRMTSSRCSRSPASSAAAR